MLNKITLEQAIIKCKLAHGELYDYSKMVYKGHCQQVEIICKEHGSFWQLFSHHVRGRGCLKCTNSYPLFTNTFIQKAKIIHKNKFDYKNTNYINNSTNVIITCPVHGDFIQNPSSHLKGFGCDKCSGTYQLNTGEFIKRAISIHGYKYNYSKSQYIGSQKIITITCPVHGDFKQRPHDHCRGIGCSMCKVNKGETLIANILKLNNIKFKRFKSYKECRYKLPLRFDFYLPESNTLIEYDGWQHFFANERFGGEEAFRLQEIKDEIKIKYCEDNNIVLIRLPYWLSKEELEEILINDIQNN